MITVEKITKRFGNKTALNQIQFNVDKGEIFGFLGPRRRFKWLLRKTKSREELNRLREDLRITK